MEPLDVLTPGEAARVLGITSDGVRAAAQRGAIAGFRTPSGRLLFDRRVVEALARTRAEHTARRVEAPT